MDTEGATNPFCQGFGISQVQVPHSDDTLESSIVGTKGVKLSGFRTE